MATKCPKCGSISYPEELYDSIYKCPECKTIFTGKPEGK